MNINIINNKEDKMEKEVEQLIITENPNRDLWYQCSLQATLTIDQNEMLKLIGDTKLGRFRFMMQNLWRTNQQFRNLIITPAFKELAEESLISILIKSGLPPKININEQNYVNFIKVNVNQNI